MVLPIVFPFMVFFVYVFVFHVVVYIFMCVVFFFFFFQAEDGIRDYKVTGVQTCALPISADGSYWSSYVFSDGEGRNNQTYVALVPGSRTNWTVLNSQYAGLSATADTRSEERRVGKECRSRWSPYH